MERSAFKSIVASFMIMMAIVFLSSCGNSNESHSHPPASDTTEQVTPDTTVITVTSITPHTETYEVLVTNQSNNTIKNGATGAILGGATSYLLGGSISSGAILGGTAGVAMSGPNTAESYYETRVRTTYQIHLSDNSMLVINDWNPFKVGDAVTGYWLTQRITSVE